LVEIPLSSANWQIVNKRRGKNLRDVVDESERARRSSKGEIMPCVAFHEPPACWVLSDASERSFEFV